MIRFENRKKIQYSLLGVMVATLILLLSAVAIRFFQESKLSAVGNQLTECSNIKSIIKESREELSNAQIYLYSYLTTNEEPFLDRFYQSLKDVTLKIDSTRLIESTLSIDGIGDTLIEERGLKLERLELLIDSIALLSPKLKLIQQERREPIRLERPSSRVERVEEYIYDTIPRRNFFQRLSDAFKGDVIVKRDTVFITTKYHTDIDLDKAQSELDSTLDALYIQHINRLQQYEEYLSSIRSRSVTLFKIYNNLFTLSTGLIDLYDTSFSKLEGELEKHYSERSINIQRVTRIAFSLLILLLIAGVTLIGYYTKLSFSYESRLAEANSRTRANLQFKNRILGMLSHEIRSPLKIMNLFLEKIRKKSDDQEVINNLNIIQYTNSSLLLQANQILEYTKDPDKLKQLKPELFNLQEEIKALIKMFQPYVESINNRLIVESDIDEQLTVLADRAKFHQLFINLLGNANKFTSNGVLNLKITSKRISNQELEFYTTLSDSGSGIAESDLEHIFEPYYKGELLEKVNNLGVGLGLNLCKTIVELYKGTISATSEVGVGTTIKFHLQMKIANGGE